jgi:hypothetical protein
MGKKTGDQSQEHYTSQPPSAPPEFEEDGHQGTAASVSVLNWLIIFVSLSRIQWPIRR